MSITVTLTDTLAVTETITGPDVSSATIPHLNTLTHTQLTSSTTPPVTKHVAKLVALTAGAATIDLTALTAWGTNGVTEDCSGLKLQILQLKATSANANPITITKGASNGYEAFGADWSLALSGGQEATLYGNDKTPDVAAGAKTIDLAGTLVQSILVVMTFG